MHPAFVATHPLLRQPGLRSSRAAGSQRGAVQPARTEGAPRTWRLVAPSRDGSEKNRNQACGQPAGILDIAGRPFPGPRVVLPRVTWGVTRVQAPPPLPPHLSPCRHQSLTQGKPLRTPVKAAAGLSSLSFVRRAADALQLECGRWHVGQRPWKVVLVGCAGRSVLLGVCTGCGVQVFVATMMVGAM